MRVVIDASIDPRLVEAFVGEDVLTLFDLGWQHLKDNVLVNQLECDVFVTADHGFEHQHKAMRAASCQRRVTRSATVRFTVASAAAVRRERFWPVSMTWEDETVAEAGGDVIRNAHDAAGAEGSKASTP